jgi:hypothetical protein
MFAMHRSWQSSLGHCGFMRRSLRLAWHNSEMLLHT